MTQRDDPVVVDTAQTDRQPPGGGQDRLPDPSDTVARRRPAPTDCRGADQFSGPHRAGYGDRFAAIEYWARKGGTLMAGEGAALCAEIDRLRAQVESLERALLAERRTTTRLRAREDGLREITVTDAMVERAWQRLAYLCGLVTQHECGRRVRAPHINDVERCDVAEALAVAIDPETADHGLDP